MDFNNLELVYSAVHYLNTIKSINLKKKNSI